MSTDNLPVSKSIERVEPDLWVEHYGDYLYRYAVSRLRDSNAAEETVQETFLAGIKYHHQYSGRGSEQGWLLGILKRKIVDFVRRRAKHNRVSSYEDDADPTAQLFDAKGNWRIDSFPGSPAPDANMQSKELWQVVRECLRHLPQGQADVFVLSVMEDMGSDEICKELEITPSNLWVRMHRARLGLAKCVGATWHGNEEASENAK